ncbi:MAG TPA: trigger factor [Chthoniobacterales bacterium]|jgi:trigger factor|nr:trigger factor [Chthoniobacterales bacterium]
MNVEVETLPNCIASLHIELPPEVVTKEWNEVVKTFRQAARIPGFRPGKAPQNVVEAKFRKEIQEELTKKLVSETTREAIREKGLKVLSISDVDAVEFTPERSMKFTAMLITSPEFELPEYKGLPVRVPSAEVAPEDVERGLQSLRERQATFSDVEGRAVALNDFAVIDYATTLEGKPLHEVEPKAPKILQGRNDFWIKLDEQALLKGFSEHLVGMTPNEAREFDLQLPSDYPIATLANQVIHCNVTLKSIKSMQLPELTEEFASQIEPGLTLEQLKKRVEEQIGAEKKRRIEILKQNQIVDYLASSVECELPQSYVKEETRRIMSEIVQQNQLRGVSEDVLRENQKDIISTASRNARERLKTNFILNRIAEKEGIEVEPEELRSRVRAMANQYRVKYEKMMSDLEEKRVLGQVSEEVLMGKVLDFLTSSATVEVVPEEAVNG